MAIVLNKSPKVNWRSIIIVIIVWVVFVKLMVDLFQNIVK
jgi:hypothetical protein